MKKEVTRRRLADALLKLAEKKEIDRITVREIVDVCGFSSQTFYNYFPDKYALIIWIYQSFGTSLLDRLKSGEISFRTLVLETLEFYSTHSIFLVNAVENTHGADSFIDRTVEKTVQGLMSCILEKEGLKEIPQQERVHLNMYAYACLETFYLWLRKQRDIPAAVMAEYVIEAMPVSLKKYIL